MRTRHFVAAAALVGVTDRSGYYDDRYVRTADGWRIEERIITFDSAG